MKTMKKTVKRTFITGLVVILPVLITVWVIHFLFNTLQRAVTPLVLDTIRLMGLGKLIEQAWINWVAPVVSVVLALLVIYILGLIGGNVLGRQLLRGIERLVMQVPVARGIYAAVRQFLEVFSSDSRAFRKVVLVEYPRKGLWTLALLTSETEGEVQAETSRRVVSVFIPTTPNPTSGWLLFVPKDECVELEMSVDDAFKLIISGGVLTPPYTPPEPADLDPPAAAAPVVPSASRPSA